MYYHAERCGDKNMAVKEIVVDNETPTKFFMHSCYRRTPSGDVLIIKEKILNYFQCGLREFLW